MNLRHLVMIVNHQVRGVTTSGIGGALRLVDGEKRTGEWNQLADPKVALTRRRGHGAHIISNSPAFLIEGFLSRINNGHISMPGMNSRAAAPTNGGGPWARVPRARAERPRPRTLAASRGHDALFRLVSQEDAAGSWLCFERFSWR